ncbi:hypothetical protein EG834_10835, partial [bacterium]|nr:hypothetical protein [bacterium]
MQRSISGHGKPSSLKGFIFAAILGVSLVTFFLIYLVTTTIYHRAYTAQANAMTRGISDQISRSLMQLMEKGWTRKELFSFLDPVIHANADVPVGVAIYRADSVTAQYGAVDAVMRDATVRSVMESGTTVSTVKDDVVRHVVAVRAEAGCLSCHANAKAGAVLGVLDISQDLSSQASAIHRQFLFVFLLLSPLPLLMGLFISRRVSGKVERATTLLHEEIKNVNS